MPIDRDLLGAVPISHPHDDVQLDGDAPGNDAPPVSPLLPGSMHRAEDDRLAQATSPEFHNRPVGASDTAPAATRDPDSSGTPRRPDGGSDKP